MSGNGMHYTIMGPVPLTESTIIIIVTLTLSRNGK